MLTALVRKARSEDQVSEDTPVSGFDIQVEHMRRWRVIDNHDQSPIVFHAEQLSDGGIAINQVSGAKAEKAHIYTVRQAKMLHLLLGKVLEDV